MYEIDGGSIKSLVCVSAALRQRGWHKNTFCATTAGEFFNRWKRIFIEVDKLYITSLLDNALKYSATEPVISIHLKREASYLELPVTDNGIGIPAAYQEKIFEKFFRVPSAYKNNIKGYGLGLSYVLTYTLRACVII